MSKGSKPVLYGATWCGFCHTLASYLHRECIDFQYKNVDKKEVAEEMLDLTDGKYLIPTLVVGGVAYQNPAPASIKELLK